jgi:hypothetical protein
MKATDRQIRRASEAIDFEIQRVRKSMSVVVEDENSKMHFIRMAYALGNLSEMLLEMEGGDADADDFTVSLLKLAALAVVIAETREIVL